MRRIQKESNSTKPQSFNAGFGEVAVPLLEPKLFYGECNNPDANDSQRSPMALQWHSNPSNPGFNGRGQCLEPIVSWME